MSTSDALILRDSVKNLLTLFSSDSMRLSRDDNSSSNCLFFVSKILSCSFKLFFSSNIRKYDF
jgi:hypothetical protein